jgi:hypothetical protein
VSLEEIDMLFSSSLGQADLERRKQVGYLVMGLMALIDADILSCRPKRKLGYRSLSGRLQRSHRILYISRLTEMS